MSSRFSAARPKRAGENFARTHHHDVYENDGDSNKGAAHSASSSLADAGPDSKRVKFDVRNPSALAPDAREDDAILEADVIGGGGATKRGAVNLDGYDSDSDNETFHARSDRRSTGKKGDPNLLDQLDNYNTKHDGSAGANVKSGKVNQDDGDDEEDEDMFAANEGDDGDGDGDKGKSGTDGLAAGSAAAKRKEKQVRFLDNAQIKGQELHSKSGGRVRIDNDDDDNNDDVDNADDGSSSDGNSEHDKDKDNEEARRLAAQEQGVDEEVGLGGLKRHAPKVEAFNMKEEQEEGRFDADGNFIRKAADPDAVHDKWLDGLSRKEMKRAAAAHERRELEATRQRMEEDQVLTTDILEALIVRLNKGETSLEALSRLGRGQQKARQQQQQINKKIPKWKLKKQNTKGAVPEAEGMDIDQPQLQDGGAGSGAGNGSGSGNKAELDTEQARIKKAIDAITDAADKLLSRDHHDIYDREREMLVREWQRETGEDWVEPAKAQQNEESGNAEAASSSSSSKMWEFRWTDGRDGADKQGPFDDPTMKAWQDAGYFGEGVEFRLAGDEGGWSRVADFDS